MPPPGHRAGRLTQTFSVLGRLRLLVVLALGFAPLSPAQQAPLSPGHTATLGGLPLWLATGDFNGDGIKDVAVADAADNLVQVLLGNGDGTFRAPKTYPAPVNCGPLYIGPGDFKKDGKLDLILGCDYPSPSLAVLPGSGDGTFGAPIVTPLPQPPLLGFFEFFGTSIDAAIADYNRDGNLDIALATASTQAKSFVSSASMYWGNGDGTFTKAYQFPFSANPIGFQTADFNQDGLPDLAVLLVNDNGQSVTTSGLLILLNRGNGTFATAQTIPQPTGSDFGTTLHVADLNGDGRPDLLVGGFSMQNGDVSGWSIAAFLAQSDGSFAAALNPPGSNQYMMTFIPATIFSPGRTDLVVSAATLNQSAKGSSQLAGASLIVLPGDGKGGFGAPVNIPYSSTYVAVSLAAADLRNNGLTDLAAAAIEVSTSGLKSHPITGGGDLLSVLNTSPLTFTDTNAASFATGPQAAGAIVSAFGQGFAVAPAGASALPLPVTLGGVNVNVTDSTGTSRPAPLFYVAPGQVNFAIPSATSAGPATVTISGTGGVYALSQPISTVAPGLFQANGLAAGNIITVTNGVQKLGNLIAAGPGGNLVPAPINVSGPNDTVYLVLYGTGIRNHATAVTATIGSLSLPTQYAGPQGTFDGEDQVNVQLPASLAGSGLVNVSLTVDGQNSNAVKIQIQ